jgi:hypothetical protein
METPDPITDAQADPEVEADEADEEQPVGLVTLAELLPMSQYMLPQGEWDRPPSDRVQFALDLLIIAAADRARRLLNADLTAPE